MQSQSWEVRSRSCSRRRGRRVDLLREVRSHEITRDHTRSYEITRDHPRPRISGASCHVTAPSMARSRVHGVGSVFLTSHLFNASFYRFNSYRLRFTLLPEQRPHVRSPMSELATRAHTQRTSHGPHRTRPGKQEPVTRGEVAGSHRLCCRAHSCPIAAHVTSIVPASVLLSVAPRVSALVTPHPAPGPPRRHPGLTAWPVRRSDADRLADALSAFCVYVL